MPRLAEKEMSSFPKEEGATASLLSPEQLGRLRARVYFELNQVAINSVPLSAISIFTILRVWIQVNSVLRRMGSN